jgi:hypothetical protein
MNKTFIESHYFTEKCMNKTFIESPLVTKVKG